jgi:hypothetical protein
MSPVAANAATRGHVLAGANATQLMLQGTNEKFLSNGYASYAVGTGFSYFANPNFAIELDAFYTNRKFGFGSTNASFSTFQIPLTAQYHFLQFHVGGGAYTALWSFNGEMVSSGQAKTISVAQAGQTSSEMGYVLLAGLTQRVYGLPLRLEARRFQSIGDIAKSNSLKGTLTEWQFLLGYEIDTDAVLAKWFGIAPNKPAPKRSKKTAPSKAEPPEQNPPETPSPTGEAP